ncbi:hypothetical protein L228DRAFT_247834 [Xylona heveae TC161]|uniref:HTH CENPB-type domain-containing protein n=1 Tax=Xylona heveae (strain CBS 132557 / TC161) TaxID=1328760 RepID=A0A165GI13_XYLHT|nr:hypothetical protein L228DRAFT_247834 [Xylona heveae TC161]KZF22206.1 hypothetical protein L228DRAFT_247834 [Xylona heveae TC161]
MSHDPLANLSNSTVSKVLRQKEKYLFPDDGSRSPVKRSKGKFPDIERALSNWARNYQKQGLPLTDSMIKEKARFFATTVGSSESHLKANSSTWLEKFKQKNNLAGSKSAKSSNGRGSTRGLQIQTDSEPTTPNALSPVSPGGLSSPSPIRSPKSQDSTANDSPSDFLDFSPPFAPISSANAPPIPSIFSDSSPQLFSQAPHSPTSPFFSPDLNDGPSPLSSPHVGIPSTMGDLYSRPRSQTFPMLGIEPTFVTSSTTNEGSQKYTQDSVKMPPLETSLSQGDPHRQANGSIHSITYASHDDISPLSIHASTQSTSPTTSNGYGSPTSPSQDDARRALELVMAYFQHQPSGFVDPQDYMTIGKLMEKLRIQGHDLSKGLPGGLHHIPEHEMAGSKKDQSLNASL